MLQSSKGENFNGKKGFFIELDKLEDICPLIPVLRLLIFSTVSCLLTSL